MAGNVLCRPEICRPRLPVLGLKAWTPSCLSDSDFITHPQAGEKRSSEKDQTFELEALELTVQPYLPRRVSKLVSDSHSEF